MATFEEIAQRLPEGIAERARVDPPNKPMVLHSGRFSITQGSGRAVLQGKIVYHWLPSPEVRFEGRLIEGARLDLDPASLRTTPHGIRGVVLILHQGFNGRGVPTYSGVFSPMAVSGQRRGARSIRFDLVNFPEFNGSPVRYSATNTLSRARLEFRTKNWLVMVDQVPRYLDRMRNVRRFGGYAVTHCCEVRRSAGGQVSFAEAEEISACVHFFLAFLAGQWVGPVLHEGVGTSTTLWRRFGSWKATSSRRPRSWFPNHQIGGVDKLFQAFHDRWTDPLWSKALRTLVSWFVQANAESGSTEAALVASFIPLEMLSWLVVVEDGKHLSARKFDKLKTAERIQELLVCSGVPRAIPADFARLRDTQLARAKKTGPQCLTAVRNALVHPKRTKRNFMAGLDSLSLFELKELALSYVELAFLRALGYRGMYARRVFSGWKGEELIKVPWT